jgi:transposase InsO family protein
MVTAEYPDNVWQADLIDFSQAQTPFYKDGDGNQYLASELKESDIKDHNLERVMISDFNECSYALVVIDVFSRYVWVRNLINNTAYYVSEAFQHILMENGKLPNILQTDLEKAFISNEFQTMLKNGNIKWWGMTSKQGAVLSERVIQTLKRSLWKVFVERDNPL